MGDPITKMKGSKEKDQKVDHSLDDFGNTFEMPSLLDQRLYQAIENYRNIPGNSWLSLARDVVSYVNKLYEPCWALVEAGRLDKDTLERNIYDNTPSETYIRQFRGGRPICFRYTNTLANFFGLQYTINNFNPAKDFEVNLLLKK